MKGFHLAKKTSIQTKKYQCNSYKKTLTSSRNIHQLPDDGTIVTPAGMWYSLT